MSNDPKITRFSIHIKETGRNKGRLVQLQDEAGHWVRHDDLADWLAGRSPVERKLFLQWFAEQYQYGVPDASVVSQSLAHIEGILAADPERFVYLRMVAGHLRSFEVMLRALKQEQVKVP